MSGPPRQTYFRASSRQDSSTKTESQQNVPLSGATMHSIPRSARPFGKRYTLRNSSTWPRFQRRPLGHSPLVPESHGERRRCGVQVHRVLHAAPGGRSLQGKREASGSASSTGHPEPGHRSSFPSVQAARTKQDTLGRAAHNHRSSPPAGPFAFARAAHQHSASHLSGGLVRSD
jgi:hypothetical protein